MRRLFALLLASLLLVFLVLGPSKLLFRVWPTSLGDRPVPASAEVVDALKVLLAEKKFLADPKTFYPGAMSEASRLEAQLHVDLLLQRLIVELPEHRSKAFVLGAMKTTLAAVTTIETEERDQTLRYCEQVLQILGIESSGQLFNVWRYGVPVIGMRNA